MKIPNWVRPRELMTWKYWLHVGIIAVVVLFLLGVFLKANMLSIRNILFSIPLLAVGDVIAHTLLRMD